MQSYGLAKTFGYDDVHDYFASCDSICVDPQMDMCLAAMGGLLLHAKERNIQVTKEFLQQFGKNIEYYDGVTEWFDKINAVGKSLGYTIEHYIVSSGMKEVIEGTSIAKHFKRIYACNYAYIDNVAFWPSQIVNYTSKTQYIYRIRKGALDDLKSLKKITQFKINFVRINGHSDKEKKHENTDKTEHKTIKKAKFLGTCYKPVPGLKISNYHLYFMVIVGYFLLFLNLPELGHPFVG